MKSRIVSFILTLSLLLTCASTLVVAESAPTYGLDAKTVTVGDEFTMTVSIANNPGIISLRFTVEYDSEKLQLLEVSDLKLLNGFTTPSPTISSPYTLRWADSLATTNNIANGKVVTLKFKALAETDATAVSIKHAEARNASGKKVTFENVSTNVKVNINGISGIKCGDINGDDDIDAFDYQMLKAFVLGTYKDVTDKQKKSMDINHDNRIDAFDYQMLKAHVLGTYVIQ